MKYVLVFLCLLIGFGVAVPPLVYTHTLPVVEAVFAGVAFSFAFFLLDPTRFLKFSAEARKTVICYLKKGDS
jgi:hypothetical protein